MTDKNTQPKEDKAVLKGQIETCFSKFDDLRGFL